MIIASQKKRGKYCRILAVYVANRGYYPSLRAGYRPNTKSISSILMTYPRNKKEHAGLVRITHRYDALGGCRKRKAIYN